MFLPKFNRGLKRALDHRFCIDFRWLESSGSARNVDDEVARADAHVDKAAEDDGEETEVVRDVERLIGEPVARQVERDGVMVMCGISDTPPLAWVAR